MNESQIMAYRLMVVPGGNFIDMSEVEGESGKGWVILTGVHPEAPESWRRGLSFTTPASVSNAYAATLIEAALRRTSLPHY